MPALICLAEMEGFGFPEDELRDTLAAHLEPPEAISKLADQSFHARLLVRLNEIKSRARQSDDDALFFQADAARYFIEEARGPPWDNPLVVACYYKSIAGLEQRSFAASACLASVKAYERKYKLLIAEKTKAYGQPDAPVMSWHNVPE